MFQLVPVFVSIVFLSLNYGALLYVNSTFLGEFFSPAGVTTLFLLGPALNIFLFFFTPRLLTKWGKEKLFFLFTLITLVATAWLALSHNSTAIAISFVAYVGFMFMTYWCLDIFLEEKSLDQYTGELRGIYFTLMNAGIAAGPLIVTLLSESENLRPVYFAATFLLLVPLVLSFSKVLGRDPSKELTLTRSTSLPFKTWWRKRNIRAATIARLVLETFFGVMIVYTPIYLHGELGFEWNELGIIFMVMLLPFVILEWPAGELADRLWGEKEMMSIGFFITGSMLLLMPFLEKDFVAWMIVLFLSRVGASLIEIMTETYFFKKIDAQDTGFLSIFRLTRPIGIILGVALGAVTTVFLPLSSVFFIVAVVIFYGLVESLYLKDTL